MQVADRRPSAPARPCSARSRRACAASSSTWAAISAIVRSARPLRRRASPRARRASRAGARVSWRSASRESSGLGARTPGKRTRSVPRRRRDRPTHGSSASGMSTTRARSHSPRLLAWRVLARRGGDAFLEQAVDHEVERADRRQAVAIDLQRRDLGQQLAQLLGGEDTRRARPRPRRCARRRRGWRCRPCRPSARRRSRRAARAASVRPGGGAGPGGGVHRDVCSRGSPTTTSRVSPPSITTSWGTISAGMRAGS